MALSNEKKLRDHIAEAQKLITSYIHKLKQTDTAKASVLSPASLPSPAPVPSPTSLPSPPPPHQDTNVTVDDSDEMNSEVNTTIDEMEIFAPDIQTVGDVPEDAGVDLPDLNVDLKVDSDMDISLKDDNNAVDVSLDYEYDEFPLDYDEADDKHASTRFRPVSAKETETDTASVPPAASLPLTSGVTCTTYRPRRTKVNKRNVRDWRADWQSD